MKLRYLHLRDYPPIRDTAVCFSSASPLQKECSIRFVVGLNGSGKSNLLRALAEVFLALSDQQTPHFPVSLIYELGDGILSRRRTIVLDCPGNRREASLWMNEGFQWPAETTEEEFENAIGRFRENAESPLHEFSPLIAPGEWPTRATTPPQIVLPKAVFAYTTGAMPPWESLWKRENTSEGVDLVSQREDYDAGQERPVGWTAEQEARQEEQPKNLPLGDKEPEQQLRATDDLFRRPLLLTPSLLKCALLAVSLPHALIATAARQQGTEEPSTLDKLLKRGGWHAPITVAFRMKFSPGQWSRTLIQTAHQWILCAGEAIAEPHPSIVRTLYFDLEGAFSWQATPGLEDNESLSLCHTQGEALWTLLGGHEVSPFSLFSKLVYLYRSGLFEEVDLRLRREPKRGEQVELDAEDQDLGVLRFEELSDGEQMILGRMALFYLLQGQSDALLLLDEPETHFNDLWKREIVQIIDEAIGQTANDVMIASHSAIVLTDVLNDEIVLMRNGENGAEAFPVPSKTFGADPSELIMRVFGADDSVGQRAQRYIEGLVSQLSGSPDDIQRVRQLIEQLGSGFYRTELRTLLSRWEANA